MKNVIVLGSGGHASVLIDAMRAQGVEPRGITDPTRKGKFWNIEILGPDEVIFESSVVEVNLVNGLGNRASRAGPGLEARTALYTRWANAGYVFPVVQHPAATVSRSVHLGHGSQVMAGAVVNAFARTGHNIIINTRAVVEHDCQIGPHCHIAPGAILCGGAWIGAGCHIGAGAIVLGGVRVGDGSVVAAGAVVSKDVEGFADRKAA